MHLEVCSAAEEGYVQKVAVISPSVPTTLMGVAPSVSLPRMMTSGVLAVRKGYVAMCLLCPIKNEE